MNSSNQDSESILERSLRFDAVSRVLNSNTSFEDLLDEYLNANSRVEELESKVRDLEFSLENLKIRDAKLKAEVERHKMRFQRQTDRVEKFKVAYEEVKESRAYKVGRKLTNPPQRVMRMTRELQKKVVNGKEIRNLNSPALELGSEVLESDLSASVRLRARKIFQREGGISEPLKLIEGLGNDMTTADKLFCRQLRSLLNLSTFTPTLSARQNTPAYTPERGSVLYCAHSTGEFHSNGYSNRTTGIVRALQEFVTVTLAARPGYPWDSRIDGEFPNEERYVSSGDSARYVYNPGASLIHQPLEEYFESAADSIVREAILCRAEIIHAASNHLTAIPALIAARRLGVPLIYEVRGLWEITEAATNERWQESERYRLAVDLESFVICNADWVLSITNQVTEELVNRGADVSRITHVPNAADPFEFAALPKDRHLLKNLGIKANDVVIGYAGSLLDYEGLETLIDGFENVAESIDNTVLLIIGDGPARSTIDRASMRSKFSDRILLTGRIPSEQVQRYMTLMDIVVCARESNPITEMVSPLKPLEAFACGKALVASRVAPLEDLCGANQDRGLLFEPGNSLSLAQCLKQLVDDKEQRQDLGRTGRRWLIENRTWPRIAADIARTYKDVLIGRRATESDEVPELRDLTIALISDNFTRSSIVGMCEVVEPTPENWLQELSSQTIHALVVESAWSGINGRWHRKVGFYTDELFQDLESLVLWCRDNQIPTIFWNKEDPVHFNRFVETAKIFDHVFTTDDSMISKYQANKGSGTKTVASLPFWAQPKIHNPLPTARESLNTVAYGGSYYGDRFPERSLTLSSILKGVASEGLSIYDRQTDIQDSPYQFPEEMIPYVRGGLSYEGMLAAYKSHPIHINVNSVVSSRTMFSRRVMELGACGTPVISGPGLGVETLFDQLVPVVASSNDAKSIAHFWLNSEKDRNNDAWRLHRHVYRAHLAGHRLLYVLRTAGLKVRWSELPDYVLNIDTIDSESLKDVLQQTHLPRFIKCASGYLDIESQRLLREAGIEWLNANEPSPLPYSITLGLGIGDTNLAEDLCRASSISNSSVGVIDVESSSSDRTLWTWGDAARETRNDAQKRPFLELETQNHSRKSSILLLRRTYERQSRQELTDESIRVVTPRSILPKTITIAGHDLKFANGLISHLEQSGHRVLIDKWNGHDSHLEDRSKSMLRESDIVYCEWALGNLAWYSKNVRSDQRLVARFHSQELFTTHISRSNLKSLDILVFVGEYIRQVATRRFDLAGRTKSIVIPNAIGVPLLQQNDRLRDRFSIGLVGYVPEQKRLDLALDLIRRLRIHDPRFRLFVKGKRPEEFSWMKDRPQELNFYDELKSRLKRDPLLRGAVYFVDFGTDMSAFYDKLGHVVSLSDFESFHMTLIDGPARGALAHSLAWPGSEHIYPSSWLSVGMDEMTTRILELSRDPDAFFDAVGEARTFVEDAFASELVLPRLEEAILGDLPDGAAE